MDRKNIMSVDLGGMSNESISSTLKNKVTPYVYSTADSNDNNTVLVVFNDIIECTVKKSGRGTYSVTRKYRNIETEDTASVKADELLTYLYSVFGISIRDNKQGADVPNVQKTGRKRLIECSTPMELKEQLNQYIISQNEAKMVLSVAAYNHAVRVNMEDNKDVSKANVMLIGPTGTGKTAILRALAERCLKVPYCTVSATSLTATGFTGADITDSLTLLLNQTKKFTENNTISVPLAECGIIFIDEVDKIRKHGTNNTAGQDIGGESVQQALLSMVEGNNYDLHPDGYGGRTVTLNTRNILFVVGGAFPDLSGIIRTRIANLQESIAGSASERNSSAYEAAMKCDLATVSDDDILQYCTDADLEEYGFIPEFIGRFPNVCVLHPLSTADYLRILTEPKDSLVNQFTKIFAESSAVPEFSKAFLSWVANECTRKNRGARGLRAIFEQQLNSTMFIIPSLKEYAPKVYFDIAKDGKLTIRFCLNCYDKDRLNKIFDRCSFDNAVIDISYY